MKSFYFFLILFTGFINSLQCQKLITIEDMWSKYAFMPKAAGGFNVMKDGMHYTDLEAEGDFQNIVKYDLKSGKKNGDHC